MSEAFLDVRNLVKHFPVGQEGLFQGKPSLLEAVDDVSFTPGRGETLWY
jgi:ABC-type oligopeptide transport system ATPase subunit